MQNSVPLTGEVVVVQDEVLQLSEVPQLLWYWPCTGQHSGTNTTEESQEFQVVRRSCSTHAWGE